MCRLYLCSIKLAPVFPVTCREGPGRQKRLITPTVFISPPSHFSQHYCHPVTVLAFCSALWWPVTGAGLLRDNDGQWWTICHLSAGSPGRVPPGLIDITQSAEIVRIIKLTRCKIGRPVSQFCRQFVDICRHTAHPASSQASTSLGRLDSCLI